MNKNAKKLKAKQAEVKRMLAEMPTIMGVDAVNHFKKSWDKQGFTDQTLDPWAKRKSKKDTGRAVLVGPGTGDLKKSVRVISKTSNSVTVGSDLPYAQIHNEGGPAKAWGKWPFTMPKRQFMGRSALLIKNLRGKIQRRIKKIFK